MYFGSACTFSLSRTDFWRSISTKPWLPISPSQMNPASAATFWTRKKSSVSLLHFWIVPLNRAQTFLARGHSYNTWPTVSLWWWHSSHLSSILIRFLWRFSLVGRHPEHALHRKVRTFGGTFNFHIFLQVDPSTCTDECSAWFGYFKRRATWYAERTVNHRDLFSFQISLFWEFWWVRGSARMDSHVRLSNVANSFPLSHCQVSLSIRSITFISLWGCIQENGWVR